MTIAEMIEQLKSLDLPQDTEIYLANENCDYFRISDEVIKVKVGTLQHNRTIAVIY